MACLHCNQMHQKSYGHCKNVKLPIDISWKTNCHFPSVGLCISRMGLSWPVGLHLPRLTMPIKSVHNRATPFFPTFRKPNKIPALSRFVWWGTFIGWFKFLWSTFSCSSEFDETFLERWQIARLRRAPSRSGLSRSVCLEYVWVYVYVYVDSSCYTSEDRPGGRVTAALAASAKQVKRPRLGPRRREEVLGIVGKDPG